jgi:hypothetical protein
MSMRYFYLVAMFLYRVKNALSQGNAPDPKGNKKKAFVDSDPQTHGQTHQQRHRCWIEKLSFFHNASSSLLTQNYPVHHFGDNRHLALTAQNLRRLRRPPKVLNAKSTRAAFY